MPFIICLYLYWGESSGMNTGGMARDEREMQSTVIHRSALTVKGSLSSGRDSHYSAPATASAGLSYGQVQTIHRLVLPSAPSGSGGRGGLPPQRTPRKIDFHMYNKTTQQSTLMLVQIIPNLWLGDGEESCPPGTMLVVNCTMDKPFLATFPTTEHIRVDVDNAVQDNRRLYDIWMETHLFDRINTQLANGKHVLVHCDNTYQRSAATVAAYLIHIKGYTFEEAIEAVQVKLPEAFGGSIVFHEALNVVAFL